MPNPWAALLGLPGRALRAPVLVPGALVAVAVAVKLGRGGVVPTDGTAHALRLAEAGLLRRPSQGEVVPVARQRASSIFRRGCA